MHLIDADELYFAQRYAKADPDSDRMIPVLAVDKRQIDAAPMVDAVPVVRCKDCKFFATEAVDEDGWCENPNGLDNIAKQTDFCSYGERKDGEGNG